MFKSITVFDKEIAIQWDETNSIYIDLIKLRKGCPCAWCSGEKDVFGNIYKGDSKALPSKSFKISSYKKVGLYGLRFFWEDGHNDGIYTIERLNSLGYNE